MSFRRTALLACVITLLALPMGADPPGVLALTGGTVHPVSGPAIPNGTVVIRAGLIEAVGANVAIPADASIVDVRGSHVYPGLIDAHTSAGFASAQRRGAPRPGRPAAQQEQPQETSPASSAARSVNLSDEDLNDRRGTGVTTIVTAPSNGIFNGQSVVLNLSDGTPDTRIVKTPAATQITFAPRAAWTYPSSLMGVIAYVRQTLLDAQHQTAAAAIYDRAPAGERRPPASDASDALAPALARNMTVVFVADTDAAIQRAAAIAKEFNLRAVVAGARQGYRVADELKSANIPALVSVRWPQRPSSREDREEQPLRLIRDRQMQPTTPAALAQRGVPFALVSGGGKAGDLIPGIRKAIENGLSADDALRATTLWPARIFGVDRQLGTLDRGKIANVVVTDQPIFAKDAKVTRVIVDGREVRLPPADKRAAAGESSPIEGTWSLTARSPEGEVAIRVTFNEENGQLTGNFSSERGSGEIRSGTFDGTNVEFSIALRGQQATESSEWAFRGTVTGNSMEGTVSSNLGSFAFSGSKP